MMGGLARVRFAASDSVILFHGNSLVYGATYASQPFPGLVQALAPISNTNTCVNLGTNGIQTPALISEAPSVIDARFDAAKKNLLVVWEGRNHIFNGGATPAQAWSSMQTYIAGRLAAHPQWKIVLMTCIPQRVPADTDATCAATWAQFEVFNNLMRNGWRATGAKALVDTTQTGSPFANLVTLADFNGIGLYNTTADPGYYVHLVNAGNAVIGQMVASALRRLPKR